MLGAESCELLDVVGSHGSRIGREGRREKREGRRKREAEQEGAGSRIGERQIRQRRGVEQDTTE
jgi:hypothetical protein